MIKTDVLIIGAGPAGCAAATYTTRAGLKTTLLAGAVPGGQLLQTNDIENYPGFIDPISGFDLMDKMHRQIKRLGAESLNLSVVKIDSTKKPFEVTASNGDVFEAHAVIIATGSAARWLYIDSEAKYKGKGVSACATCDGFFFKGKEVCVVGGGNTAFEDALFLTNFCKKVYLIHRREGFRAHQRTVEKAKANPNIEFVLSSVIEEIQGDEDSVKGVVVNNVVTNEKRTIPCSGVFVAVGSVPQTDFLKGTSGVELEESGHVKTDDKTHTNIEGIFAAGDCADSIYRQAIIACGSGAKAAIEAIAYVNLEK